MEEQSVQTKEKSQAKTRRRKVPLGLIIPVAAIVGVVIGVVFAIIFFANRNSIIGTWVREGDVWTYEFKKDGSGSYGLGFGTPIHFHYEVKDDSINITYDKKGNQSSLKYRIEDGKLIIKNQLGKDETYEKKEQN